MSKQEIADFCDTHDACYFGKSWAVNNCDSMHEVWLTARPDWLIWVATSPGVLPERDLRLFACWCVRQVWHLLTDERSKNAVIVAEKYAVGEATAEELAAACVAAKSATAAKSAAAAARAARAEAKLTAVQVAELSAASAAEWAAAPEWAALAEWAACVAEAAAEAQKVAQAEAREAQALYLRDRFSPFLKEGLK